jgi:TPR repeat protein
VIARFAGLGTLGQFSFFDADKGLPVPGFWRPKAAEQGYDQAQTHLGLMYVSGQGVPQDYVIAHMWLNLAAASGDDTAAKGRDLVAKYMTHAQIAEAQKLVREWKPK